MSLITACPACQTQFEVTEAELRAYHGKVRCGECEHVFDATAHLLNDSEDAEKTLQTIAEPSAEKHESFAPTPNTPTPNPPIPNAPITVSPWQSETEHLLAAKAQTNSRPIQPESEPSVTSANTVTAGFALSDLDLNDLDLNDLELSGHGFHGLELSHTESDQTRHDTVTDSTLKTPERTEDIQPDDADSMLGETRETIETHPAEDAQPVSLDLSVLDHKPEFTPVVEPSVPEFLRNVSLYDERQPQPKLSPATKSIHFALLILLVLGLCLQYIYFSRTQLAAHHPQIKPLLYSACRLLHCEIELPREIAQLTIDDADIQEHRERAGVLVFSSVLMNHAQVVQAYPLIELTLTNTNDEPVLRRVLKPAEYLPNSLNASEGLAAQQEVRIHNLFGVNHQQVAGFRVAIAYD